MTRLPLILLAASIALPGAGQAPDHWRVRVLPLVRAAFPELAAEPLQVQDTEDGSGLAVALAPRDASTLEDRAAKQPAQVIVRLACDEAGRLRELAFSGPLTHENERAARARHDAAAPPLVFGADAETAIRERVPVAALRRLVGPLVVETVIFDAARAEWRVDLSSGPAPGWRLTLEPYGGRVVHIVRLGGGQ